MKYRIISSSRLLSRKQSISALEQKKTLLLKDNFVSLPIAPADLFSFGIFYDPYSSQTICLKHVRKKRQLPLFSKVLCTVYELVYKLHTKILARIAKRKMRPSLLPAIFGALCGALAVSLLSFGVVIYSLFIKDYFRAYESVIIPKFVGYSYSADSDPSYSGYYNIHLTYEHSKDIPKGYVISQTPTEGVVRRIYDRNEPCDIYLVVSLGEKTFTMNDYYASELREAMLDLKKEAIKLSVKHIYSSEIGKGKIVSTSPSAGETFSGEDIVTITVSLGPEKIYVTIPNIYSLTEARAEEVLRVAGLSVGSVSYISSEKPAGTVISQSLSFGDTVEKGSAISFVVSAGIKYQGKKMPDLYGLSIDDARSKLAEYGLVLGNIYGVANGAPKGTVISQSVLPDAPINSGLTSIDIYVSS